MELTQEVAKSEQSSPKQQQQSSWWSRLKAVGHGVLEAVGLSKEK